MKLQVTKYTDSENKYNFLMKHIPLVKNEVGTYYECWAKDIVINDVAINEHTIHISVDSMWVSEYDSKGGLLHEVIIQMDKLQSLRFTTENDVEYYFEF